MGQSLPRGRGWWETAEDRGGETRVDATAPLTDMHGIGQGDCFRGFLPKDDDCRGFPPLPADSRFLLPHSWRRSEVAAFGAQRTQLGQ